LSFRQALNIVAAGPDDRAIGGAVRLNAVAAVHNKVGILLAEQNRAGLNRQGDSVAGAGETAVSAHFDTAGDLIDQTANERQRVAGSEPCGQLAHAVFAGRAAQRPGIGQPASGRNGRAASRRCDERLRRRRCWRWSGSRCRIIDDDIAAGAGRDDFVRAAASQSNQAATQNESALNIFHSERSPQNCRES